MIKRLAKWFAQSLIPPEGYTPVLGLGATLPFIIYVIDSPADKGQDAEANQPKEPEHVDKP